MPISIDLHGYDKKVKACYKRALTCEQLANSEGSKCEQTNSDFGTLKRIADLYEEAANNIQQMIDLIQKDPVPNEIAIWLCEVRAKQYHCLGDHAYFISKDFPGYISYHEKSADAMQQALSLLPESKDAKQQRLYYSGMMYYVMADAQDGKATLAEQEGKFRRAVVEREKQKDFIEKEFEFFKDIVPKERIYHHISRFWIAEYSRLICMAKISESDSNFDQTLEYLQESAQAAERARQASPDWPPYGQMCRQTQLIIDEFLDNHPELAEKESIDALLIKSIGKKGEENEKALSKVISSLEEKELKSRKSQIPRCYKIGTSFCPYRLEETSAQVFIGMPFRSHYENVYKFAIEPALMSVGLAPWKANQAISNIDIMCKMCHAIQQSAYSIIDISDWNPNVMFELGLVYALHKRTLLIKQQHANVPVDLSGMEVINYSRFENLA